MQEICSKITYLANDKLPWKSKIKNQKIYTLVEYPWEVI